jgi:curved DNA-binding protein CbpA
MSAHAFTKSGAFPKACAVLGLRQMPASKKALRARFLKLAHDRHPDKHGGSTDKMTQLTEAYKTLSLELKRVERARGGGSGGGDGAAASAGAEGGMLKPEDARPMWFPWMKAKPKAVREWEDGLPWYWSPLMGDPPKAVREATAAKKRAREAAARDGTGPVAERAWAHGVASANALWLRVAGFPRRCWYGAQYIFGNSS